MQNIFGAGSVWGRQLTDNTGAAVSNPTPVQFGVLQDCAADFSFDNKELYGQNQYAVAVGRGKGKIGIKAKMARINGLVFNNLFFGQPSVNSGIIADFYDTTGEPIPTTPFQITIAPPSSGVYSADLGVYNGTTGQVMTRVASGPTTGQYMVVEATGVYTFATADAGNMVYISYQYTATSTVAKNNTVSNVAMGYAPTMRLDISMPFNGKSLIFTFPNVIATKMSIQTKLDDFAIPDFEASAFADSFGHIVTWAVSDI